MLSTLLSQLQNYFSKYFVVGSFCPMLAFAFANGLAAYTAFPLWRAWVKTNLLEASVGRGAFLTTSVIVGIILASYVLSSLSTFLRRVLEGKSGGRFVQRFIKGQTKRRKRLTEELTKMFEETADLSGAEKLKRDLRRSRELGRSNKKGMKFSAPTQDLDADLKNLEQKRDEYAVIKWADLERSAQEIRTHLESYDVDEGTDLNQLQNRLVLLVGYANERANARKARLQNELNSNFGDQEVAPTKMGNVANTIQSYALRRYQCNLETIWSNLLRIVQKDANAQATLQETKTQLDFLVACCWLTLLWGAVWTVIFALFEPSNIGFLVTAIGAPAVAYMWYRAAAEQYRSFADVAMTALDAFRLDLLKDMRLRSPADVEEERYVWESVDLLATYGEERNFRYEQPKQP